MDTQARPAAKYLETSQAVDAYDRAWEIAEAAVTSHDIGAGIAAVDAAERKVRESWTAESSTYADARTAHNVRELGLPTCAADWRFLRDVVLKIT